MDMVRFLIWCIRLYLRNEMRLVLIMSRREALVFYMQDNNNIVWVPREGRLIPPLTITPIWWVVIVRTFSDGVRQICWMRLRQGCSTIAFFEESLSESTKITQVLYGDEEVWFSFVVSDSSYRSLKLKAGLKEYKEQMLPTQPLSLFWRINFQFLETDPQLW